MRNIEIGIICRIVENPKEYKQYLGYNINTKFFDSDTAAIIDFINNHYNKFGKVPNSLTVKQIYPDFEFCNADEPVSFYCEEIIRRISYDKISSTMEKIRSIDSKSDDFFSIEEMVSEMEEAVSVIKSTQGKIDTVDYCKSAKSREQLYNESKLKKGMLGGKTPWLTCDNLTYGWQKGFLVTIQGLAKEGKTWIALRICKVLEDLGFKVGIFTSEMMSIQLELRLDSMQFNIPFADLKKGTLSPELEKKYKMGLRRMALFPKKNAIKILPAGSPSYIQSKIKEYGFQYWLIDGFYLCDDDKNSFNRTDKMYNLTQSIKKVANITQTCGFITLQLLPENAQKSHDKGEPLGIFGTQWSKSSSQDSDVVIEIVSNEVLKSKKKLGMFIVGQRDGDTGKWYVDFDLDKPNFNEVLLEEVKNTDTTAGKKVRLLKKFGKEENSVHKFSSGIGTRAN